MVLFYGHFTQGRTLVWELDFDGLVTGWDAAFGLGMPYFVALSHGVPLNGNLQGIDKHGCPFTQAIRPVVTLCLGICAVCIPLLLSGVAWLRGWFGVPLDS